MQNKKIVITGGCGFVGSNLANKLEQSNQVLIIDNLSNSILEYSRYKPILEVGDAKNIEKICNKLNFCPHIVFHLGEYSRVETSFEDVDLVLENNRRSFSRVLKFCCALNAKLVYSGSSTKFSKKTSDYIQSPYELSKAENVATLNWYASLTNLNYATVYFYNVYGLNEKSSGKLSTVVAKFLKQYHENRPLTVRLPGNQKRNFTHVEDVVDGLIKVALKGKGDGYAIGNPKAYSITELANLISNNQTQLPPVKGNRMSAEIDLSKILELGWRPYHDLKTYIETRKNEIDNSKRQ